MAVIPVIDEERTIGDVVRAAAGVAGAGVVVVDGGSADATIQEARAAGARVIEQPAAGYGRACMTGARAATDADVVVFLDGDGADPVEQAPLLVDPILAGQFDLVLGARSRRRSEPGALAVHQALGNQLVAHLLNVRFGLRLSDISPFRAIRRDVLDGLAMREMTYGWPTEMIRNAAKRGHRVSEVPVDYRRRRAGESKVSGRVVPSARAGWHMVRVALG